MKMRGLKARSVGILSSALILAACPLAADPFSGDAVLRSAVIEPFEDRCEKVEGFQLPFEDAALKATSDGVEVQRGPGKDGGADWPQREGVVHVSLKDLPVLALEPSRPVRPGDRWAGSFVFFRDNGPRDFAGEVYFEVGSDKTGRMMVDARPYADGLGDVGYYWVRLRPAYSGQGFVFRSLGLSALSSGEGLRAEYYDNKTFTRLRVARLDPEVNFDWGAASPDPAMGEDIFAVRWSGRLSPRFSETYTFTTLSDDGVRLWVDGRLLIDHWTDHPLAKDSGGLKLEAGKLYDLRLEYYENGVDAAMKLFWSSPSQKEEIIPSERLYLPLVAAPEIVLAAGSTASPPRAVLRRAERGSVVRYTLKGDAPGEMDKIWPQDGILTLESGGLVKARAWKELCEPSQVVALSAGKARVKNPSVASLRKKAAALASLGRERDAALVLGEILARSPDDAEARRELLRMAGQKQDQRYSPKR